MSDVFIHKSAFIDEGAKIGDGSKIWHFVHVRSTAEIGKNVIIGKGCYIDSNVKIGNNVKIQNLVSVYDGVSIENEVFVGPHVTFTNDLHPRAEGKWNVVKTKIKTGASLGANSTIICGNTIGEYALVAAGSVVTKNVPDHALVAGNPAKLLGWVCFCAHRIAGKELAKGDYSLKCETCGKINKINV